MKRLQLKKSQKEFRLLLQSAGAQAAMMVLKPGKSSSKSVENEHPRAEQWLFVISGKGRATVGKRSFPLPPHALLLIEKGERHRITNVGKESLVTLNFYAPPAYARDGNVLKSVAR